MFTSLRSRLWLSYALVISAALFVVAVVLIIYLIRNPVASRQALASLRADQAAILADKASLAVLPAAELQSKVEAYDRTFNTRILVLDRGRQVVADSRASTSPALSFNRLRTFLFNSTLRDNSGRYWLVSVGRISDNRFLILAMPRPKAALLAILADELFPVFALAGVAGLLLSLLLAFWLSRWIANPMQTIIAASRAFPVAPAQPVPVHGPREVQDLARAFNDMTTRVQAGQKSQREFVANVSHELKTPLTSVQGFAQAILDGTAGTPDARQQAATVIYEEAGRMHRMVLDLLDLARLDAGTADLQRVPVDIPALLHGVAGKFTPQARAASVEIRVIADRLPSITGDGDRLAQVFTNLIDNALKYTPPGGEVILRASQSGNEVQVEVADAGAGIPAEAVPHIFDRFYQADASRTGGKKHGTGLGLAIVKEIVGAHGGTISVRSIPGQGSLFTVRLPLVSPDASTIVRRRP